MAYHKDHVILQLVVSKCVRWVQGLATFYSLTNLFSATVHNYFPTQYTRDHRSINTIAYYDAIKPTIYELTKLFPARVPILNIYTREQRNIKNV